MLRFWGRAKGLKASSSTRLAYGIAFTAATWSTVCPNKSALAAIEAITKLIEVALQVLYRKLNGRSLSRRPLGPAVFRR
jgi:hypothetical protein